MARYKYDGSSIDFERYPINTMELVSLANETLYAIIILIIRVILNLKIKNSKQ
jgi:hypothetical protein